MRTAAENESMKSTKQPVARVRGSGNSMEGREEERGLHAGEGGGDSAAVSQLHKNKISKYVQKHSHHYIKEKQLHTINSILTGKNSKSSFQPKKFAIVS